MSRGMPEAAVVEKFHFTRAMIEGPIYRKYEKAISLGWDPRDLDYAADVAVWDGLSQQQREGILTITPSGSSPASRQSPTSCSR